MSSPSSAAARAALAGSFESSASPRCARRADSSCAYRRPAAWAARFQYSAARTPSRATSKSTAMCARRSLCSPSRAASRSAIARLSAAFRVARSDVEARVLVHVMREPVVQRERPVRRLRARPRSARGRARAPAVRDASRRLPRPTARRRRRWPNRSPCPGRSRPQEAAVAVLERVHLALDQAAYRFGQLARRWPAGCRRSSSARPVAG